MEKFKTRSRISYGDTDKMGYCYYGNYPKYYEIGRTEMLRSMGLTYRELEEDGIIMPVVNMNINYKKPAFYDDLITIQTSLKELKGSRIIFQYEIFNEKEELLNYGETTLAFIDVHRNRPVIAPEKIVRIFNDKSNSNGIK